MENDVCLSLYKGKGVFRRDAKLECTRTCVTSPDRDMPHSERLKREKVKSKIALLIKLKSKCYNTVDRVYSSGQD